YKKNFLEKFSKMRENALEKIEKLEQLRILENGYKIKVVVVNDRTIPVDNPQDIKKVEEVLKK
ncbi:MAG: 3-deoxy-manno-octulosonate cytidylyltransferase, partial [Endomicrobiia bacterium]